MLFKYHNSGLYISIMLKKSVFLILFFLIFPISVYSLGLGDITVFSRLNEPLKIQFEIVNSKQTPLDEIVVSNASRSAYRQANLPRPESFNRVRFKAKKISNGSIIVELTSKRPVREPFITFIADLKWRGGHLIREYTFLLDPPEFVQQHIYKSKKTSTVKKTTSKKVSVQRAPRKVTHRKVNYSTVIANHIDDETYEIKRADTLWHIAKKVKPQGVSSYQTMQALYALNPNAFIRNNIDLLKVGQTLKIPTQNEILQINGKAPITGTPASASRNKVSTISKQEKPAQTPRPSPRKKELQQATQTRDNKSDDIDDEGHLKIIPSNETLLSRPVTSKKDLILINKALQNSITTIKSLKNENEVLSDKIDALTKKLSSFDSHNQNLNSQIEDITEQLKNNKISPVNSNKMTPQASNDANIQDAESGQIETAMPSAKQTEDNTLTVDSTLAQAEPRSFIRELLTSPVITFALAIFTLIILVTALFTIRSQNEKRKQKKQNAYVPFPERNTTKGSESTAAVSPVNSNSSKNSSRDTSTSTSLQGTDISDEKEEEDMDFFEYFEKKINAPDSDSPQSSSTTPTKKITPELQAAAKKATKKAAKTEVSLSQKSTEISFNLDIKPDEIEAYEKSVSKPTNSKSKEVGSTLGEIDTYLAYGNYNEAENRLLIELKRVPSDKNLHLKLFECYTYSNKRYEFIQHAEKNMTLLTVDMVLRHRVENIFQQTWNEPLDLNSFL